MINVYLLTTKKFLVIYTLYLQSKILQLKKNYYLIYLYLIYLII